jgi:hypothetical protein
MGTAPEKVVEWEMKRNKQCNFDTVLQVISLRSQPENISDPVKFSVEFSKQDYFGFLYEGEENQIGWTFDFTIAHKDVFANETGELGELFIDCDNVPMIKTGNEWSKLDSLLCTSPDLRNIYFEVIPNEE